MTVPHGIDRRTLLGFALTGMTVAAGIRPVSAQSPALRGTLDGAFSADGFGVRPNAADPQTARLQAAIHQAAAAGRPLFLPAGRYVVTGLSLPSGTHIVGMPGATRLVMQGGGHLLAAADAERISLTNLVLDGQSRPIAAPVRGLFHARRCGGVVLDGVEVVASAASGIVLEGCAGRITNTTVAGVADAGIHALDARGLRIEGNTLRDIGNNAIQVWRGSAGEDGTIVQGNRISHVRWVAGGNGQNGNGINVFRAANVIVANNRVTDCAFSAIRVNGAAGCQITGNTTGALGEVAIFVEFGFTAATVTSNMIDGAAAGISATNFDHGGRLATIQGNIVRNLAARSAVNPDTRPYGIAAEADGAITGNVVEDSPGLGLQLGWGPYLRDVTATGNVVRRCAIGIGVSVAPGAGRAVVSDNLITQSTRAAIAGMAWDRIVAPDLTASGDAHRNVTLAGNRTA